MTYHTFGTCAPVPCATTKTNSHSRYLEIVDRVQIPSDLPEGDYVLGWRWDCEQSNQIWMSCSDVTISHK